MRFKDYSGMKDFFAHRQHPLKMLNYTKRSMWLILIPLGKYLIASKFNFRSWIEANWVDILTVGLILGYTILRWLSVYFEIKNDRIIAHTGFFGIYATSVYFSQISTLTLSQGALGRLFHMTTVYIDTDAVTVNSEDIRLDVSQKQANNICDMMTERNNHNTKVEVKAKTSDQIIFSFLFSTSLTGVIIVFSLFMQAYFFVGTSINDTPIVSTVSSQIDKVSYLTYVPSYLILAGLVVVFGWILSFIANLMRHWNFSCTRCGNLFIIQSGFVTRRRHILVREKVNYIDFRQSLLMKIFKINNASVKCTGYGKRRRELSALVPITTSKKSDKSMSMLMPDLPTVKPNIKTGGATDLSRFIMLPLICSAVIPIATVILTKYYPEYSHYYISVGTIMEIPSVWLTIVKAAASFITAVGFDNDYLMASYCSWYAFHKIVVSVDKVNKIAVSQNPFQKVSKTCNLMIYTSSEKTDCHAIKGLSKRKTLELLKANGYFVV